MLSVTFFIRMLRINAEKRPSPEWGGPKMKLKF